MTNNIDEETLARLRTARENPEGRRAHFLCSCGCPISSDREDCPGCGAGEEQLQVFGVAILTYRRAAKQKRFNVR